MFGGVSTLYKKSCMITSLVKSEENTQWSVLCHTLWQLGTYLKDTPELLYKEHLSKTEVGNTTTL